MEIREIKQEDNADLAVVLKSVLIEMGVPKTGTAYEDPELNTMFEAYQGERSRYYVITDNNKILGGAGIAPLKAESPSICELQKMYFSPQTRGLGMGYQMIVKCLDFAKVAGFELCYLETLPNMKAAQKLYQKLGFEYITNALGKTGHTSCSVWMTKALL